MKMVRGVQFMEWTYPLYMQNRARMEGEGVDYNAAFSKILEETTGVTLNPKEWGKYLPT